MHHVYPDLKLIPRIEFERIAKQSGYDYANGLGSWSQFVAMMFSQLGRTRSFAWMIWLIVA